MVWHLSDAAVRFLQRALAVVHVQLRSLVLEGVLVEGVLVLPEPGCSGMLVMTHCA